MGRAYAAEQERHLGGSAHGPGGVPRAARMRETISFTCFPVTVPTEASQFSAQAGVHVRIPAQRSTREEKLWAFFIVWTL